MFYDSDYELPNYCACVIIIIVHTFDYFKKKIERIKTIFTVIGILCSTLNAINKLGMKIIFIYIIKSINLC